MAIIGIDLGTTTTVVARLNEVGKPQIVMNWENMPFTYSSLEFPADGEGAPVLGQDDQARQEVTPLAFQEYKRNMGTDHVYQVGTRRYTAADFSAIMLRRQREHIVNELSTIERLVITTPANFGQKARQDTLAAAAAAGLPIPELIDEPTAAALYYIESAAVPLDGLCVVFDFGGGTLDVSLVEVRGRYVKVKGSKGVAKLGGMDLDRALLGLLRRKFEAEHGSLQDGDSDLIEYLARNTKHRLTEADRVSVIVFSTQYGRRKVEVTRMEFEEVARPIIAQGRVRGVLLMSRSPRALFRGVYEDRGKIVFGLVLILALLTLMAGLVSRGITRPIVALSRAAREVTAGRGDVPETPSTAAIEIRALYEDFREMAEAIETRSRYLRDFAAAVSHEFKTPLAGIGGAVELLQDHFETMSAAERRRFLDNIAADNARLTQLVTRLLDMARADMARPEAGAAVDILPAARRVADSQPALKVTIDLTDDLPAIAVPEATIEAVLTTLLENSRQAGARSVVISAAVEAGQLCLAVQDDGPGIAEADRERLFEPFFTSHRADGGTGLGLSIARSLLAASHASIAAAPCKAGARFELRLPLA